jgi:beta-lactamase superfamily II metal-dependent hydrolase
MRRLLSGFVVAALAAAFSLIGARAQQKTLDIYFIDVEGGQSTLFVSPSGESLLVDAGFPGQRDAERIVDTIQKAGLKQVDYFVGTHYHGDHIGAVPLVAAKVPIRTFIDHETTETSAAYKAYVAVRDKGKSVMAKPGDKIPIAGIDVQVVTAGGALIKTPLASAVGAGAPNPLCSDFKPNPQEPAAWIEDARSVGMTIRYGRFSMLDLGDLPFNIEHDLVCPNNLLGTFDVYLTTRHGLNISGSKAFVHALRHRVAVMNNGPDKGAAREAWTIVKTSPGLEDLWQVHYSQARKANATYLEFTDPGGPSFNTSEQMIANLDEAPHNGPTAHLIRISARNDGSFAVTNMRNGFSKEYAARTGGSR